MCNIIRSCFVSKAHLSGATMLRSCISLEENAASTSQAFSLSDIEVTAGHSVPCKE